MCSTLTPAARNRLGNCKSAFAATPKAVTQYQKLRMVTGVRVNGDRGTVRIGASPDPEDQQRLKAVRVDGRWALDVKPPV